MTNESPPGIQDHAPAMGDGVVDERIAAFLRNGPRDTWTQRTARRILEEDADFFRLLGDR